MSDIKCPSGLRLRVRGLKGKELKILEDKASHRNGTFVDKLFSSCVMEMLAGGPYDIEPGKSINWDNVLIGDRYAVLLAIRADTFGQDYNFSIQCKSCDHKFQWNLRLDELPVQELAPEDAEAFSKNEPMIAVVDGKTIKFRLGTGKDEKAASQHKKIDNAIVTMLARKIVEIEGVGPGLVRAYLEDLDLAPLMRIQKEFQRRDCGTETTIDIECPECETESEVELPLGRSFWMPEDTTK